MHPAARPRLGLLALALAALVIAGSRAAADPPASTDAEHFFDPFVDRTADPRADFFRFAVGKWTHDNPIPADERGWGIGYVIQEETYRRLIGINDDATRADAREGSSAQKSGDFWTSAMDSTAQAKQGFSPLADEFARIEAVRTRADLLAAIAHLKYIGASGFCRLGVHQDEKNSARYVVHVGQGGLGLPERDYYFDKGTKSAGLRRKYVAHVARMFWLLGDDSTRADTNAGVVMALETDLARASRKLAALRDPIKNYHAMTLAGADRLTRSIAWKRFLADGHIDRVDTLIVGQPEFLRELDHSLRTRPIGQWKTYLRWHLAHSFAEQAGGAFDDENFHFYGTVLTGVARQRPRWKRMLDEEENYLGDALGQLYVERYFPPRDRARYEKLTDDIFAAFRARIGRLEWMSAATKERAVKKLDSVIKKIGYPDKWRDYAAYNVDRTSFLGNVVRGNIWQSDYAIARLNKPVDRSEWFMTPQTYNAYYNSSNNEIVAPAANFILPGIADSLIDDAVVYAYAGGSTIGHEITHGLDDDGRQFDEQGNLKDWWTPEDTKEFKARAAKIVNQFDGYIAVDSLHANGAATTGENIADLGGLQLAWDAFTQTDEYKSGKPIGGYTPAQRFFLGWALAWMYVQRPEVVALRVKTDYHSPEFLRVNAPTSNLPPFYEAFGAKEGDAMYRGPDKRVQIW
jgi:putative endopeptidase